MSGTPSRTKIKLHLRRTEKALEALRQQIEADKRVIAEAKKRISDAEKAMRAEEFRFAGFSELLIVDHGLAPDVAALRDRFLSMRNELRRTDITVARLTELEDERDRLMRELRNACPHSFLLSYDERPRRDPEDYGVPERRTCIICGAYEQSKTLGAKSYEILFDSPQRIVKRDLRKEEEAKTSESFWQPIEFYLAMYRLSAGKLNAVWNDEEATHINPSVTARAH